MCVCACVFAYLGARVQCVPCGWRVVCMWMCVPLRGHACGHTHTHTPRHIPGVKVDGVVGREWQAQVGIQRCAFYASGGVCEEQTDNESDKLASALACSNKLDMGMRNVPVITNTTYQSRRREGASRKLEREPTARSRFASFLSSFFNSNHRQILTRICYWGTCNPHSVHWDPHVHHLTP